MLRVAAGVLLSGLLILGSLSCGNSVDKKVPPPKGVQREKVVRKGDYATIFSQAVDILFVVDDSGSMTSHQTKLIQEMDFFLQELGSAKFLDYHIGVLTSSMESYYNSRTCCGNLVGATKYVTRTTPNGLGILRQNLLVGVDGSGTERFFDPLVAALSLPKRNNENQGFYRPEAHLAVIFLTEAEDQSARNDAQQTYDFLKQLKGGDADRLLAYAAYIPSSLGNYPSGCPRDGWDTPSRIEAFLKLFNPNFSSISFSLCASNYGARFAKLTADLMAKISGTVLLARLPIEETIRVTYGSQTIPNDPKRGWVYDPRRNALIFGAELELLAEPEGTEIQVEFDSYSFEEK